MRVALIHDCIIHVGGAERVLQNLHAVFPDAPIYTLVSVRKAAEEMFPGARIHTSFAQHLPWSTRFFRAYFPLYPMAVESFDLRGFDVILSSSFAFAKGVLPPPSAVHICYCYTPLRYLWSEYHFHRATVFRQPWKRAFTDPLMSQLRIWDRISADRVDHFVAISSATAARIAKYYRRESSIIYPPAPVRAISPSKASEDFFLLVSRLMPYKRVDLAVQAFNQLGLPLRIVGSGPEEGELRRQSKRNIQFLGSVGDSQLADCYSRCRALVFPAIEDFGIVMVEAQAYGKPVIAFSGGGASEIVVDGETGILFPEQTPAALDSAVQDFDQMTFDPDRIRQHALKFDESEFRNRILSFVEEKAVRLNAPSMGKFGLGMAACNQSKAGEARE
jgi:glycosyltransferase involved in cell wall biosynthesis